MKELQPLWVVFPNMSSCDTFNQGMQEAYYNEWFDFWKELSREEKEQYVVKWKASREWKERLDSIDELINLDIEEDARESKEWFDSIKYKEASNNHKKTFFSKVFLILKKVFS